MVTVLIIRAPRCQLHFTSFDDAVFVRAACLTATAPAGGLELSETMAVFSPFTSVSAAGRRTSAAPRRGRVPQRTGMAVMLIGPSSL